MGEVRSLFPAEEKEQGYQGKTQNPFIGCLCIDTY